MRRLHFGRRAAGLELRVAVVPVLFLQSDYFMRINFFHSTSL